MTNSEQSAILRAFHSSKVSPTMSNHWHDSDSDRYKEVLVNSIFYYSVPFPTSSWTWIPKTSEKSSKCRTPILPVFPIGFPNTVRTLLTTSITFSLVAWGEPQHPSSELYQLYLDTCDDISRCWISGPLVRNLWVCDTKVSPSHFLMLIQPEGQSYWCRLVVEPEQIQIVDDVRLGPLSQHRRWGLLFVFKEA